MRAERRRREGVVEYEGESAGMGLGMDTGVSHLRLPNKTMGNRPRG